MSGRRSLLGAAAGLLVAPAVPGIAAAVVPSPDAELVAIGVEAVPLIAEYEDSFARWRALPSGHPDSQRLADAGDAPYYRLDQLGDQAGELRATTLDGFRAKARLLQHHLRVNNRTHGKMCFRTPEEVMAWELVHDLLGEVAE